VASAVRFWFALVGGMIKANNFGTKIGMIFSFQLIIYVIKVKYLEMNVQFFIGNGSPAVRFIPMENRDARCHQVYLTRGYRFWEKNQSQPLLEIRSGEVRC